MITRESLVTVNKTIKKIPIEKNGKTSMFAEVHEKVKAFRTIEPAGRIVTKLLHRDKDSCLFSAEVYDADERLLAIGHAAEFPKKNMVNVTSMLENCETSAVGRALSFIGIGTRLGIASYEELQYAEQAITPATEDQLKLIADMSKATDETTLARIYQKYGVEPKSIDKFHADKVIQTLRNIAAKNEQKPADNSQLMDAAKKYA